MENFEKLLGKVYYLPVSDVDIIRRSYEFTEHSNRRSGNIRFSGEPAVVHSLAVAEQLIMWRMSGSTISAGILHDIIEDPEIHTLQIRATFQDEIAFLVDGVTKLKNFELDEYSGLDADTQYFTKLFLSSAADIRVALIKLADRLHNMRTLQYLPYHKRIKNCIETEKIFIPLARFLGLHNLRHELEEICLKYTQPEIYEILKSKIKNKLKQEDNLLSPTIEELKGKFYKQDFYCGVRLVSPNLYSIYQKLITQPNGEKTKIHQTQDRITSKIPSAPYSTPHSATHTPHSAVSSWQSAVENRQSKIENPAAHSTATSLSHRVVSVKDIENHVDSLPTISNVAITVDTEQDCYTALGITHSLYKHLNGTVRDFVYVPDYDLRRRLETECIDNLRNQIKIQIASEEMKKVNELGITLYLVNHTWLTKTDFLKKRIEDVQSIIEEFQQEKREKNSKMIFEIITDTLSQNEIFVFSNDKTQKQVLLPMSSYILDFVYAVYPDIAHRFKSAYINEDNNNPVDINYILESCDRVRIVADENITLSLNWLSYTKTLRAKELIKKFLSKQSSDEAINLAKKTLHSEIERLGLRPMGLLEKESEALYPIAGIFGLSSIEEVYAAVGYGTIHFEDVMNFLYEEKKKKVTISDKDKELKSSLIAHAIFKKNYEPSILKLDRTNFKTVSLCEICTPIPHENIEGCAYGKRVIVHLPSCKRLRWAFMRGIRRFKTEWSNVENNVFPVRIKVKLLNRKRLLQEIAKSISENDVNVVSSHTDTDNPDRLSIMEFIVEVSNNKILDSIKQSLTNLQEVISAERV